MCQSDPRCAPETERGFVMTQVIEDVIVGGVDTLQSFVALNYLSLNKGMKGTFRN